MSSFDVHCTAIVPFERRPQLHLSAGLAGELCSFDPYSLLGIPPESSTDVAMLSRAGPSVIRLRTLRLRNAYLALAARYHPDTRGDTPNVHPHAHRPNGNLLSDADLFSHISVAYHLLLDLELTVKYHLAASVDASNKFDELTTANVSSAKSYHGALFT